VRTNTLVKGSVVEIDSTPFKEYYEKHYQVRAARGAGRPPQTPPRLARRRAPLLLARAPTLKPRS